MIRNILLVVFILSISLTAVVSNDIPKKIDWLTIEHAQKMSVESEKPIFIDFTAAWCGWCKKMDKTTFKEPEVIEELDSRFLNVRLNFDSTDSIVFRGKKMTVKALAKEFDIQGLPTMVVMSSDFESVDLIIGFQNKNQMLHKLKKYSNW